MLVLGLILLVAVPAVAILWPFFHRLEDEGLPEDEGSAHPELRRRWDAALAALKSAELERALGALTEEDYTWVRQRSMAEAAALMRAMELEEAQKQKLLASIEQEVQEVRRRVQGPEGADAGTGPEPGALPGGEP